jgi:predicted Zn-dependent peptidase
MMEKQFNFLKILLAITIFFSLASSSLSFDLENKVSKFKLKNGITVLMLERHLSPTVSLYIRHRVGAVDEVEGESGAAHFLEHMMFKGTKTIGTKNYPAEKKTLDAIEKTGNALDREKQKGEKADIQVIQKLAAQLKKLQDQGKKYFIPNEIDRLYTENGGMDLNASTGHDVTTYKVSLPSNKIELWARIESDRLMNPVFREFYTERDVIMEERRQRVESDPEGKLYEQFLLTAFKVHPYRKPVLGWTEDMKYLSPDAVNKIFQKYKAPSSIVIAAVGDIDTQKTLRLIEKYFWRIPVNAEQKTIIPSEPQQTEERKVLVSFDASPMMIMGYHKPTAPDYDDYVLDLLETILTKGRTSRLYNLLVTEMGIAESVSASNGTPGTKYPNLFTIFAAPRNGHTNEQLEDVILQEIEKLKTQPIPEMELTKAKNQIKMTYLQGLDSNADIASTISYYEVLLGDYKYFANYLNVIDKITAADIQNTVRQYFNKENLTIAQLIKKKD